MSYPFCYKQITQTVVYKVLKKGVMIHHHLFEEETE